jgi:hypothetical protein
MAGWAPAGPLQVNSAGLTIATTAYTSGDQLGTEITLSSAAAANNGFGAITGVELIDYAGILGGVDLYVFVDSTTPASDNAASSWSTDADMLKSIPGSPISIPAPVSSANNRTSGVGSIWLPFRSGSGHSNLYLDLITRSAHTFFGAVGDIHLNFYVMQYS